MPEEVEKVIRDIPVIVGHNQEHIMAKAEIFRTHTGILIQITNDSPEGLILVDYLSQAEPIAIHFAAIPVQNSLEKRTR